MKPVLAVEFHARGQGLEFDEESVVLNTPEELFKFVEPGGGCETIPDEVDEIRVIFLAHEHSDTQNPATGLPASLQLGMVIFNGPLSDITTTCEQILDRASSGKLSSAFLTVIGAPR
jgi:hypothetical protein